ncbi:hypothetical protein CF336_g6145 [Tilletia laevis]|nr:hypothetical protein CF336_g6145 [Tilletia laevis]
MILVSSFLSDFGKPLNVADPAAPSHRPLPTTVENCSTSPAASCLFHKSAITLVTSDKESFTLDRDIVERSILLKQMLEDIGETSGPIPLASVSGTVFKKIVDYCTHHRADPPAPVEDAEEARKRTTDISDWDSKFIQVDQEMLFEIILASNYLDIKPLLDVGCKHVANMIKGKSADEIRKQFNITNDFTPEEEEQIRKENEWAEER